MINPPKVSFVVPLHNKEEYIGETLASLARQANPNWEAIVVDNNSTDGGPRLVMAHGDPRIRLISSSPPGVSATRNAGLAEARGEWVCFLDADDIVSPDYIDSQLGAAASTDGADVVACHYFEFETNPQSPSRRVEAFPARDPLQSLRVSSIVYCPGPQHMFLVKREFLGRGIKWSSELDQLLGEDCGFWFEVLHRGKAAFNQGSPALYRIAVQGGRYASFCAPEKLFRGLAKAISANERVLGSLQLVPSTGQCEQVLDFFSRVGLSLEQEGKQALADQAFSLADEWLRRVPFLLNGKIAIRKVAGCASFARARHLLSGRHAKR